MSRVRHRRPQRLLSAAFMAAGLSEIITRVPAGATTGKVQVVTPSGTLPSNAGFVAP